MWTELAAALNAAPDDLTGQAVEDSLSRCLQELRANDRRARPFDARFVRDDGLEILRAVWDGDRVDLQGVVWWIDQTSDPVLLRAKRRKRCFHTDSVRCGLQHRVPRDAVIKGWFERPDWADRDDWFFRFAP